MYTLKGFFIYPQLVNNTADQVSMFGEISPNSLTYAKDKTYYTNSAASQTTFLSFHSVRDGNRTEVPTTIANNAVVLGNFLLTQAQKGTLSSDPYVLRQAVQAEFATKIKDFSCGEILTDGKLTLPEYISYTDISTSEDNDVTVWLADDSFANQYDEYTIEVIAPFTPLDDFFKDPLQVKLKLDSYNLVDKLAEVQVTRGQYPFTLQQAMRYDYQDPEDTSFKLPTYWIVLVYGQAGNNPDIIKQALVDYALNNSTHTREEWVTILPDLFLTTEFIITPLWLNMSVPNREFQAGINSPIINPKKMMDLVKRTARGPKYTPTWVENQVEYSVMLYKSLAFGVLGNPENRGGVTQFSDQFSDYLIATNTSADANRMSPTTLEWSTKFAEMIKTAEVMSQYTRVPTGMSRVVRDGVMYISQYYKNINYLVVSRASVEAVQ